MVDVKVGVVLLCLALVGDVRVDAAGWSHHKDEGVPDPTSWFEHYHDCGGIMQSPIDINSSNVLYDRHLKHFDLLEYGNTDGVKMTLHNVGGHTAQVTLSGESIHLKDGGLPGPYVVDQLHFHWGSDSKSGSEHSLDGNFYPMEMHIVHHQEHLGTMEQASQHPHGLHVYGFFFEIGDEDNANFNTIVDNLESVAEAGSSITIPTFLLLGLLPDGKNGFYRYHGSLTTPPCYETVIWTIATKPIKISETQMSKFRTLKTDHNKPLVNNYRPIQSINNRVITTTSKKAGSC